MHCIAADEEHHVPGGAIAQVSDGETDSLPI